jgi:gas vesicle protein
MTNSEIKKEENSNVSFVFGLTLGAAIGALAAVLMNKNSETEVVQNFESKIKEFFQDLVTDVKISAKGGSASGGKEIEPVATKKPSPKMFVKPKK